MLFTDYNESLQTFQRASYRAERREFLTLHFTEHVTPFFKFNDIRKRIKKTCDKSLDRNNKYLTNILKKYALNKSKCTYFPTLTN
jgi:hypothetical protein